MINDKTKIEIIENIMKNIKAVLTDMDDDEYIELKHETTNIVDEMLITKGGDIVQWDKTVWADLTAFVFSKIIMSDCFSIIFNKYKIILPNPLRKIIPDTVWNDLEYKDKVLIINAIKVDSEIIYQHTERYTEQQQNGELYTSPKLPPDTDVINLKPVKDSCLRTGCFGLKGEVILSRANSERGIVKIDNPVPEIIPCDVWNNLPDVAKEELVAMIEKGKKYCDIFEIIYHPIKEERIKHSVEKNIIIIRLGQMFSRSTTDFLDAKNGLCFDGTETIS